MVSIHFHFVPVDSHCQSVLIFIPSLFLLEIYLHLYHCLKFLQDMTILHSFCSLSVVMALLCVTIIEPLLCSQLSYMVSLLSMLVSILLPLIRKVLSFPWPLLPTWPAPSGREDLILLGKPTGNGSLPAPAHTVMLCMALGTTVLLHLLAFLSACQSCTQLEIVEQFCLSQVHPESILQVLYDFLCRDKAPIKSNLCYKLKEG